MGDAAGTTKRKIRGKRRSYVPRSVIDVPVTESVSVRLFEAIQMLTGKCDLACG